jgi:uncharacterized protein YlxW (UPF0749 family)
MCDAGEDWTADWIKKLIKEVAEEQCKNTKLTAEVQRLEKYVSTYQEENAELRGLLVRIRDEIAIDFDLYNEVCRLVGDGI